MEEKIKITGVSFDRDVKQIRLHYEGELADLGLGADELAELLEDYHNSQTKFCSECGQQIDDN